LFLSPLWIIALLEVGFSYLADTCFPPLFPFSFFLFFFFCGPGKSLIISHNGASGDYAGCTDLAYEKAIADGADIIDCSVQMSKDGVAFCLDTADLLGDTNAITSFMSRSCSVPEIQPNNGIFSFDLTWSEIQSLKRNLADYMYK